MPTRTSVQNNQYANTEKPRAAQPRRPLPVRKIFKEIQVPRAELEVVYGGDGLVMLARPHIQHDHHGPVMLHLKKKLNRIWSTKKFPFVVNLCCGTRRNVRKFIR